MWSHRIGRCDQSFIWVESNRGMWSREKLQPTRLMSLRYWVCSDVSLFVTASVVIFNLSAISWTTFFFHPYCCTIWYGARTAYRSITRFCQRRPTLRRREFIPPEMWPYNSPALTTLCRPLKSGTKLWKNALSWTLPHLLHFLIYQFAANLLIYIPSNYYWNRSISDLVIAKSRRVNFFWNTVLLCNTSSTLPALSVIGFAPWTCFCFKQWRLVKHYSNRCLLPVSSRTFYQLVRL